MQARAVVRGFARACDEGVYLVHACAVMPDHVHLVIARHDRRVEQVLQHLKARATQQLKAEMMHPLSDVVGEGEPPSPWARGTGWVVYLATARAIERSIHYVEQNPPREGLKSQRWHFVVNWPV